MLLCGVKAQSTFKSSDKLEGNGMEPVSTRLELGSTPVVSPASVCHSQQTCGADILGQLFLCHSVYDLHPGAHSSGDVKNSTMVGRVVTLARLQSPLCRGGARCQPTLG